jgi:glutaryl-CoA dehydrogenase
MQTATRLQTRKPVDPTLIPFPDADILGIADMLAPEERARLEQVRTVLQEEIRPAVGKYWDHEEFPFDLLTRLGEIGLGELEITGGSRLLRGLIYAEVTRADVSLSTLVGVHNELVVDLIDQLGSPAQREEWLPGLRTFARTGCFALTEPEHGSDVAGGLVTSATRTADGWLINGEKRWIGLGTFADFAVLFARDTADQQVKGFIVELDRPGVHRRKISNKTGLRIMQNADLVFENVEIPAGNHIPGARSFADTNIFLRNSRAWVGWQAAGLQLAIFDVARDYAVTRQQFGRSIARFQLIQEKLSRILGNTSATLSMMTRIAHLQETGGFDMPHAALVKGTGTRLSRESAALGREVLGGNGIVSDYGMARLFADAEAIYTYEGTYDMNALIVGRAVTGQSAFV